MIEYSRFIKIIDAAKEYRAAEKRSWWRDFGYRRELARRRLDWLLRTDEELLGAGDAALTSPRKIEEKASG